MRYAHLAPGHKRKAVNTLDKLLQIEEKENLSSQFGSHFTPNMQTENHNPLKIKCALKESNLRPTD